MMIAPKSDNPPSKYVRRIRLIDQLGGKCVKCGDSNPFHLNIDHKFDDGNKDRERTNPEKLIREYLNGERDINRIQVLCANCNQEKQLRRFERLTEFLENIISIPNFTE